MDELRTYIGNKENECWIIYAINKLTKEVIDFAVGRRTKETISKVVVFTFAPDA
jgi:insertion element IS1 protein InsB